MSGSLRLLRIALISVDPPRLARFYAAALGFIVAEAIHAEAIGPTDAPAADERAQGLRLRLGAQTIDILAFAHRGRPYPPGIDGLTPLFQHFAMVVPDMQKAFERLSQQSDWTPISRGGPQHLPQTSGGVTAFKFRDPEGHPLEFIAFPENELPAAWRSRTISDGPVGIDHSAISVVDMERSVAFYEKLGAQVSGETLNHGLEQDRLDAMTDVAVKVTSLAVEATRPPHVELLCYQKPQRALVSTAYPDLFFNDSAATQLIFGIVSAEAHATLCTRLRAFIFLAPFTSQDQKRVAILRDPDGHFIRLETEDQAK